MICPHCRGVVEVKPVRADQILGRPGGGRYDAECEALLRQLNAQAVLLLVVEGERGNGMSHTGDEASKRGLPDLLEAIARTIRMAQRAGMHP